tara:strand:- start:73487 stop:73708 length:222 start_codon:yes stop_codon:yes gene_type:complete
MKLMNFLVIFTLLLGFSACDSDVEDTTEDVVDYVEDTAEDAGDALDDAAEDAGDSLEEAAENTQETVEDYTNS